MDIWISKFLTLLMQIILYVQCPNTENFMKQKNSFNMECQDQEILDIHPNLVMSLQWAHSDPLLLIGQGLNPGLVQNNFILNKK